MLYNLNAKKQLTLSVTYNNLSGQQTRLTNLMGQTLRLSYVNPPDHQPLDTSSIFGEEWGTTV